MGACDGVLPMGRGIEAASTTKLNWIDEGRGNGGSNGRSASYPEYIWWTSRSLLVHWKWGCRVNYPRTKRPVKRLLGWAFSNGVIQVKPKNLKKNFLVMCGQYPRTVISYLAGRWSRALHIHIDSRCIIYKINRCSCYRKRFTSILNSSLTLTGLG